MAKLICPLTQKLCEGCSWESGCSYNPILSVFVKPFDPSERKGIHVTDLMYCHRKAWLKNQGHEVVEDADSLVAAAIGTAVHDKLERIGKKLQVEGVIEGSVSKILTVAGKEIELRGKPDIASPGRGMIVDWKTSKVRPQKPREAHVAQIQVYRWMLSTEEVEYRDLRLLYIGQGIKEFRVEPWPLEYIEEYVWDAVHTIVETEPPMLKPGEDGECYTCPLIKACGKKVKRRKAKSG